MSTTTTTATYLDPSGNPCTGRVVFRLVAATYQDGLDAIFPTVPVTGVLDGNGEISVELEPTSGVDAAFDATDMTYQVWERINGTDRAPYYVDIPTASAVDLGTLVTYDDPLPVTRQLVDVDIDQLGITQAIADHLQADSGSPHAAPFMTKLSGGQSAVLVAVGDSTLATPMANLRTALVAAYPAAKIRWYAWNLGGAAYDAAVVYGNTSGTQVIDIYSGSMSGMNIGDAYAVLATIIPTTPDVVVCDFGHNGYQTDTADAYLYGSRVGGTTMGWQAFCKAILNLYPKTPIILTLQNPQTAAGAGYAASLTFPPLLSAFAARNGYGTIDVYGAFLTADDYTNDLMANTIHPNAAGYAVWGDLLAAAFTHSTNVTPAGPIMLPDTIWVPASQFGAAGTAGPDLYYGGTASLDLPPVFRFDSTTAEDITAYIEIPTWWRRYTTRLRLVVPGTVGGNAGDTLFYIRQYSEPTYPAFMPAVTVTASSRTTVWAGADGAKMKQVSWLYDDTDTVPTVKGRHFLKVSRFANSGSDTLNTDCGVLGVLFERAD